MTHPIIKTDNYLLVVDKLNCPAKEGQTFLTKEGLIHTNIGWNYGDSVIIFHLPLNNALILDGVPLLPPLEDEIIQSLQQSKYPVAFESTIGVCSKWLAEQCDNNCCGKPEKIITITNSQGIIQVVGNYIYDQITSH